MLPRPEPSVPVHRRRARDGVPLNERRLHAAVAAGSIVRVVAGSFVRYGDWTALPPIDRHYLRVVEAVERTRGPVVVALFAAAAVWGIDILGTWPTHIDVRTERTTGGRSSGVFRRHAIGIAEADTISWRGHSVTTPAQTVLDLARALTFTGAVVVMDQALWGRRQGGPLTTAAAIARLLEQTPQRGIDRVRRAVDFATDLSDSVRESQSRVIISRLGFPPPTLQRRFLLPSGRVAFPDFYFPEHDHAGEFDGVGKYFDPDMRGERTAEQALLDEKDRGDELRRCVRALSRWRTPAVDDPRLLWDILTGDGLPSRYPRPPAGLVWK